MSEKAIIDRIISDAEQEAKEIISNAEKRAEAAINEASLRAQRNKEGTQAEINERVKGIYDGKSAAARLDGAKILLGEKRAAIDEIYARALKAMTELDKSDSLYLAEKLLNAYAEEGDEIIFAENYRFAKETASLAVVRERNLKISPERRALSGGFTLLGKTSDKDLTYGALLSLDREERQSEIAAVLFKN